MDDWDFFVGMKKENVFIFKRKRNKENYIREKYPLSALYLTTN